MAEEYKIGDRVRWDSEAGRAGGTIIKIHTSNFEFKGRTHHASPKKPQYEIKNGETDHLAARKASSLTRMGD